MPYGTIYPVPKIRIRDKEGKGVLVNADEVFDVLEKNPFWMQFALLRYTVKTNSEYVVGAILCSDRFIKWATGTHPKISKLTKFLTEFEESIKEKEENLSLSTISARHLSRLDKK